MKLVRWQRGTSQEAAGRCVGLGLNALPSYPLHE
jgi:hypothetical protein